MIKQDDYVCKNGMLQKRTYSDSNFYIRQIETGIIYGEAYDNVPLIYTYEETDIPIENEGD